MRNILKNRKSLSSEQLNPFSSLQHEVNKVMDEFYDLFDKGSERDVQQNSRLFPAIDLVEDNEQYKIEAEMPGMGEEDIQVSFKGNILSIEGEKSSSSKNEDKNYVSREISYGKYQRSITLPENADVDHAKASFKKGMLWVEIPKKSGSESGNRKIEVKKVD